MTLPPRPAPGEQALPAVRRATRGRPALVRRLRRPPGGRPHRRARAAVRGRRVAEAARARSRATRRRRRRRGRLAGPAGPRPARQTGRRRRRRRAAVPAALAALVGLFVVSGTSVLGARRQRAAAVHGRAAGAGRAADRAGAAGGPEPAEEAPLDETPVDDDTVITSETPVEQTPAAETPADSADGETPPRTRRTAIRRRLADQARLPWSCSARPTSPRCRRTRRPPPTSPARSRRAARC